VWFGAGAISFGQFFGRRHAELAAASLFPRYARTARIAGLERLITVLMAMLGPKIEIGAACARLKN